MAEPTREQFAELHDRIVAVLPVDRDGTCIVGYDPQGCPEWGDPTQIVAAIEGAFFQMDLRVVRGDDLHRLTADLNDFNARITTALALHVRNEERIGANECRECFDTVPCPTRQTLEGP